MLVILIKCCFLNLSFNVGAYSSQPNVPIQVNAKDCGVMVIKNANWFLDVWPTSTKNDIENKFSDYFNPNAYNEDRLQEMKGERQRIRTFILDLSEAWKATKKSEVVVVAPDDDDDDDVVFVNDKKKQRTSEDDKDLDSSFDSGVVIVNNNNN